MGTSDTTRPNLPSTAGDTVAAVTAEGCQTSDIIELDSSQPPYPMAAVQVMPGQEPGAPRRVPAH